jgi:hypothetical protein
MPSSIACKSAPVNWPLRRISRALSTARTTTDAIGTPLTRVKPWEPPARPIFDCGIPVGHFGRETLVMLHGQGELI